MNSEGGSLHSAEESMELGRLTIEALDAKHDHVLEASHTIQTALCSTSFKNKDIVNEALKHSSKNG